MLHTFKFWRGLKSRLSQTGNVGLKWVFDTKRKEQLKKKLITWLLMAKKRHWVMWEFGHVLSMCRVCMILNLSIITHSCGTRMAAQRSREQISLFSKFSNVCFLYQIHSDQFLQKAISLTNSILSNFIINLFIHLCSERRPILLVRC